MTDNTCGNWGAGAVGFVLGAALTGNGGLFGNNNCGRNNCGCGHDNFHCGYDEAKLNDIMAGQNNKAILDATIAGDSQVRSDIGSLTKDLYAINVQQLINGQTEQRQIDNQFCKTREFIAADGTATRAAVNNFLQIYQNDRYNDLARENAELKNKINVMPLECGLAAINAKFDAVACPGAVRTCGSGCGSNYGYRNPYDLPPLQGTATYTKSYTPVAPTA